MKSMMKTKFWSRQTGASAKAVTVILVIVVLLLVGGGYAWRQHQKTRSATANVIQSMAVRGVFVHEVAGKGNAESAKNVDITCQVESNSGTTVIWIIPEGEVVEEGDELVLLDSSDLEDKVSSQQITCNTNAASVASSQASLRTKELSLEEYIEGTFEQNWMTIENSIYEAQENQKQAADTVRYTERLVQFGYTTVAQLEAEQVSEQKYLNTVKSKLLEQLVLLRYTSEKQITSLMAEIETARAKLSSDTYTNELADSRLKHYKEQLENCTIRAPQAGQVVYANQDSRRWSSESDMIKEGSTVRERQVLIRLPDPTQMQVKTMINESNIAFVKPGMKAEIVFDALSSKSFTGTVVKVNQYPEITWMSSAKDYVCIVKIDNPIPEIRSGLTAEVKITSEKIPDVLMVPVQSIIEVHGKNYVIQHNNKEWSCKEVLIGLTNDKQVIIKEGLQEGERVISGARQYRDKVTFPSPSLPSQYPEVEVAASVASEKESSSSYDSSQKENAASFAPPAGGMPGGGPMMGGGPAMENAPRGDRPRRDGGGQGGSPFAALMQDGKLPLASLPETIPAEVLAQLKKADKDGDGFLSQVELRTVKPPRTKPAGSNSDEGDAELSQNEVLKESNRQEENDERSFQRIAPLKKYFGYTAMEVCQQADDDGDKRISREEIEKVFPEMSPFFDEWRKEGEATLSRTDLVIGFCSTRITYQKLQTIYAAREESEKTEDFSETEGIFSKEPSEFFTLLDRDQDGVLTEGELPKENLEIYKNLFKRMDGDQDQKVVQEEFIKEMEKIRMNTRQKKISSTNSEETSSSSSH